jgi:hypothetical protein
MTQRLLAAACLGFLAFASAPTRGADDALPKGFTPIFNGKDTSGWVAWAIHEKGANPYDPITPQIMARRAAWAEDAKKHWTVENGELVNDGHGAYLATEKEYGDIELIIEYKTVPKADSGIYLRATPQVQIWDSTEDDSRGLGKKYGSGGLWNNSAGAPGKDPIAKADKPFGEWNKFRIIQVGERTTVYLNDQLVVKHARMENFWNRGLPLLRKGAILLQTHGGEIRWRNIAVREIGTEEAIGMLRTANAEGFTPIFNGKDFNGWAGPLDNYEIKDGAVVCKAGKGGTIYTKEEYSDFVARVEFKLPPGHSLPRRGRYRLHRDDRTPGAR